MKEIILMYEDILLYLKMSVSTMKYNLFFDNSLGEVMVTAKSVAYAIIQLDTISITRRTKTQRNPVLTEKYNFQPEENLKCQKKKSINFLP